MARASMVVMLSALVGRLDALTVQQPTRKPIVNTEARPIVMDELVLDCCHARLEAHPILDAPRLVLQARPAEITGEP
jgi:hypothetical protein